MSPGCAAVWSTQRDEMAHTMGAVQLLYVVASDQSALRVAHEIDALAPVIASELFDSVGHDAGEFLYRPCVADDPRVAVVTRASIVAADCGEQPPCPFRPPFLLREVGRTQ